MVSLTFWSIPRRKKRVPALKTERLDIKDHVNVLLFTRTWFMEITAEEVKVFNRSENGSDSL